MMKKVKYTSLGRNTFLISFLSGTLLLITYLITKADVLLLIGFYFVIIAAVVNMLILLYELIEFLNGLPDKKASGNSVLLLLVNIPVTMLYLYIVFLLDP
ncbi:hypothetical protein [Chryseobacterium kwangjuense]|uniref:Uncharacterized protein n=1 Tax=Chryseobacterium kwangjuense TaxID=267125 RepID=A0A135WCY0_9FLAO|nr:hypothetical protein [Chryseobacterium kwangjuense]KXH82731.1 hypothetical protein AU378_09770 [Chryseobacterium kwangjuense]